MNDQPADWSPPPGAPRHAANDDAVLGPLAADRPVETIVPGSVVAALTMTELVGGRADGRPAAEVEQELGLLLDRWDRSELMSAFGMLVSAAMRLVHTGPGEPARLPFVLTAVMDRLRGLQLAEVPDVALPGIAALLTAADLGIDPYSWRRTLGPASDAEIIAWCYATWVLSDLVDAIELERAGGFARFVSELVVAESLGTN